MRCSPESTGEIEGGRGCVAASGRAAVGRAIPLRGGEQRLRAACLPGTQPGLAAIRDLITAGVNVNVTLLFSPDRYRAVAQAYFEGLGCTVNRMEGDVLES